MKNVETNTKKQDLNKESKPSSRHSLMDIIQNQEKLRSNFSQSSQLDSQMQSTVKASSSAFSPMAKL